MMWQPIRYEYDAKGNIVLPSSRPFDGEPVLIRLAEGVVEAWWSPGEKAEDTLLGPGEITGFCWVCLDDNMQVELDSAKEWMEIPRWGEQIKTWRCFHCDEVFTNPKHAAVHFGTDQLTEPGCVAKLRSGEDGLLEEIFKLKQEVRAHDVEDTGLVRWSRSKVAEAEAKVPKAEQTGYDKGVADCREQMLEAYRLLKVVKAHTDLDVYVNQTDCKAIDEWLRKHGEPA